MMFVVNKLESNGWVERWNGNSGGVPFYKIFSTRLSSAGGFFLLSFSAELHRYLFFFC